MTIDILFFIGVKIRCLGEAKVNFTYIHDDPGPGENDETYVIDNTGRVNDFGETECDAANRGSEACTGKEIYIDKMTYLFGGKDEKHSVEVGQHRFPFSFQLPENIPSSFEAENGHVRYSLKASIHRVLLPDYEFKAFFTVNSINDLNVDQSLLVRLYFIAVGEWLLILFRHTNLTAGFAQPLWHIVET